MNKEKLMECVRERKFLYDLQEREYKDIQVKDNAWAEIALECGAKDGNSAKAEWKKIRDNFRDAVKRYNSTKSGQAASNIQKYVYYNQLNFLLPFIINKGKNRECSLGKELNITTRENATEDLTDFNESVSTDDNNESQTLDTESTYISDTNKDDPPQKKIRTKKDNVFEYLKQREKQRESRQMDRDNFRQSILQSQRESTQDQHPLDIFFKGISETVKKLPEKDQIILKSKIFNLVTETELAVIDKSLTNQFFQLQ